MPKRTLFLIWLGWAVIMLLYQVIIPARFRLLPPDRALEWTATETMPDSQRGKIYLNEPFLNRHVAWDSEYYLAIAVGGYEDPNINRVGDSVVSTGGGFWPFVVPASSVNRPGISLSYAFFPFYPLLIRVLSWPLSLLGLNEIATATLAGVVVSLLGTLLGMIALWELARPRLGEAGALRAVFYLLIFPSSFFMAEVYTEGLFVGLAFASLALLHRGRVRWAVLFGVLATFTRAVGIVLVIPLLIHWTREGEWLDLDLDWRQLYFSGLPWRALGNALIIVAPALAFLLWRVSYYGLAFSRVEEEFFGRGFLSLGYTFVAWSEAFRSLFGSNGNAAAYYAVEFVALILGFVASIRGLRRYPDLAWFSLLVVFLSFTSGPAQGMHRYVLGAPALFLFLGEMGEKPAFDKLWTIASILLMGMMATMYMFYMWAG